MDAYQLAEAWVAEFVRTHDSRLAPPGRPTGICYFLAWSLEGGELKKFAEEAPAEGPHREMYVHDWVQKFIGYPVWLPGIANGLAERFFMAALNDGAIAVLVANYEALK